MMLRLLLLCLLLLSLLYWISKIIYSIWFSPLRTIPGPILLQVFPFYTSITLALGTNHELLLAYHLRYGPVFRVGWNTVVFVDADVTQEIMSTNNYEKAPNYNIFSYFGENVFSTRERSFHTKRNRLVGPALKPQNVLKMESLTVPEINELVKQVGELSSQNRPCDIFLLLHNMGYDIMGRLVFGQTFNMLQTGNHPIVGWMIKGLALTMLGLAVPVFKLINNPYNEKVRKFIRESVEKVDLNAKPAPIIANYIKSKDPVTGEMMTKDALISEAFVLLLAGTESTSNTILWVLYHLNKHPKVKIQLESELLGQFNNLSSEISYRDCMENLPYLQAVIKESMRLLPAVSGVGLRQVPAGGRKILGHYLPEGTVVGVSGYALHRSPSIWNDPETFCPERWLGPNFSPIKGSYIPFYIGPRACSGRHLALMVVTLTLVKLIRHYDLTLVQPNRDLQPRADPVLKPHPHSLLVLATPRCH